MRWRRFAAGATLVGITAAGIGYKSVYEPNQLPDFLSVSSLPFEPPEPLEATTSAGGETGLLCAANINPCTQSNALGVMATSAAIVKTAFQDISPSFVSALVAVEDQRFFENDGCDVQALARAAKDFALSGFSRVEGASGISRQLVSHIDASPRPQDKKTLDAVNKEGLECLQAKLMEKMLIAKLGSKQLAKQTIFESYANMMYFGRNATGVEAAAQQYFGKSANKLTVPESLVLVGTLNEPSNLDVNYGSELISPQKKVLYSNFVSAIQEQLAQKSDAAGRRDVVLGALAAALATGKLTQGEADSIRTYAGYIYESERAQARFRTVVTVASDNNPALISPALRDWLLRPENFPAMKPFKPISPIGVGFKGADAINARPFTDFVINDAQRVLSQSLGKPIDAQGVLSGRYTIYTSLNTADQTALTKAILSNTRTKSINGAAVSLDKDGNIVAMVGSKDYSRVKVNLAAGLLGGGGGRDAGSSNKPYALAVSIEEGVNPTAPIKIPAKVLLEQKGQKPWIVEGHTGCGAFKKDPPCNMTPSQAVAVSSNTWAADVVKQYGIAPIVQKMNALGMQVPSPYYPSLILGATAMSPLQEAVGMRGMVVGDGTALFYGDKAWSAITRIVDNSSGGRVIYERPVPTPKVVFSADIARAVTQALKVAVSQPYGTAYRKLVSPAGPNSIAGKTGTADAGIGEKDIWFTGSVCDANPSLGRTFSFWGGHADAERSFDPRLVGGDQAIIASQYLKNRPHTNAPCDIAQ